MIGEYFWIKQSLGVNYNLTFSEKSLGDAADEYTIQHLQNALKKYEEYKKVLENVKESESEGNEASVVTDRIEQLFRLKNCGSKIKILFDCQNRAQQAERDNNEYVHHTGLNLSPDPPVPEVNTGKRQKDKPQQQKNQPNKGKNNKNRQKRQNNQQQTRHNNQQRQFQRPPPQWQPSYNYQQAPAPNYNQGPPPLMPSNYHPQIPQFNYQPVGPHQNWQRPMSLPPPNYWQLQQQFTPSVNQQQLQQPLNQQQQKEKSVDNEAG